MFLRRSVLIAALVALTATGSAWAERERPLRDHHQQHRDERRQHPGHPQRGLLPGGNIQGNGFIHRERRLDDRTDRGRHSEQERQYQRHHDPDDRYPPASARPRRTVNDVIREVEGRYGGKVVGVQTVQSASGPAYRVRVLQRDGRVRTMVVPAY